MKNYNIVVLKGDGIGPEIVDEALKVLDAAGEKYGFKFSYDYQLIGGHNNQGDIVVHIYAPVKFFMHLFYFCVHYNI